MRDPMARKKPLLTIAIPTYNRAGYLQELLDLLLPQLATVQASGYGDDVEVLVGDNASTDETPQVLEAARTASAIPLRVFRHQENIGSDRNFAWCFQQSQGKYFWLFGDDDILREGSLPVILASLRRADYDLVFLAPEAFYKDWRKEWKPDPFHRGDQVIHSARHMTRIINVGVTFITGIVANRDRLLALETEAPEEFVGTNLVQLSWTLPLLREHRQSLVLWQRFVSGRAMNSGGYNVADIFGSRFLAVVNRLLPDRPEIAAIFTNYALRRWFPATLIELRELTERSEHTGVDAHGSAETLHRLFKSNVRFWIFTWPVLHLSLAGAKRFLRASNVANKIIDWLLLPGDTINKFRQRYGLSRGDAAVS